MKRICFGMTLAVTLLGGSAQQAQAQRSLLQRLSGAASALLGTQDSTREDKLGNLASLLLGTDTLSMTQLQGVWLYEKPCISVESENVLAALGGAAASHKLEGTLDALLQKVNFGPGKLTLTLNPDSTGCFNTGGRDTQFTWKVDTTDLVVTFPITGKEVRMNAKRNGNELQVSLNAERLLTLITALSRKAQEHGAASLGINALIKDVKGLYVGLKYVPKNN